MLGAIRERFDVAADAEITLEGNPESLDARSLAGFREAGITRISVGMQSLSDAVLERAGRAHDARRALAPWTQAREAGFPAVSLDLIAGLPGEDLAAWPDSVSRAAATSPDHVSVYLLESDKDTPLGRAVRSGRLAVAGDDALAAVYERTVSVLERRRVPALRDLEFRAGGATLAPQPEVLERRAVRGIRAWARTATSQGRGGRTAGISTAISRASKPGPTRWTGRSRTTGIAASRRRCFSGCASSTGWTLPLSARGTATT